MSKMFVNKVFFYKASLSLFVLTATVILISNMFIYERKLTFPNPKNEFVFPVDEEERKLTNMELEFLMENPHMQKDETMKNLTIHIQNQMKKLYSNMTLSSNYLPQYQKWAVEKERNNLLKETSQYFMNSTRTLEDLVMEQGGQPIRNIIFTTWRSGSTFLGEVFLTHPGTYYHFEPLIQYGAFKFRSGLKADSVYNHIEDILNCSYLNMSDHLSGSSVDFVLGYNKRVYKYCSTSREACHSPEFLSQMCKMYPFQLMKTVRLPLRYAERLLSDPNLNVNILFLVRDPRGTDHSRQYTKFCKLNPDCYDTSILCSDLQEDFYEAQKLREKYPNNFIAVRYEDVALNPYSAVGKLFPLFGLKPSTEVEAFLKLHVENERSSDGPYTTFRNSKDTPFKWISHYSENFEELELIEKKCKSALESWGYVLSGNLSNLIDPSFKSIKEAPWTEMIIPQDPVENLTTTNSSSNSNTTTLEDTYSKTFLENFGKLLKNNSVMLIKQL